VTAAGLIRSALWLSIPSVQTAATALWTKPGLRERYPAYLATMYGLIRASVPLMEAAVRGCGRLPPQDHTAEPLAAYLRVHIERERGHDDWLLQDLMVLGAELGAAEPGPEWQPGVASDEVAALVGAQYYWVEHVHPACLLGYIAVLEGSPPDAGFTAGLPALTGLPARAFRTLAWHAGHDPSHCGELDTLLDSLPLSTTVAAVVARNVAFTALHSARLLRYLAWADP
jgi:hypothetical protein